jgi:methylmalonyl-CoA mutase
MKNTQFKIIEQNKNFSLKDDFPVPGFDDWKKLVEYELKGISFEEKLLSETYEGITLRPLYTKHDIRNNYICRTMPGFQPFLRGCNPAGYLKSIWEICQKIPQSLPKSFNDKLIKNLKSGQTSIFISLDQTTHKCSGLDTEAVDEVGKDGVSIITIQDLLTTLNKIDLTQYPIHIDTGFSSLPSLFLLTAFSEKTNLPIEKLTGSVFADPLSFWVTNGMLPIPVDDAMNEIAVGIKWAAQHTPNLRTISVSGLQYHNAGANVIQEVAYIIATAIEYISKLLDSGLTINEISPQFRFTTGVGPFFFMEIAKLRALRFLWSNVVGNFGASHNSQKMYIHGITSGYNQTVYDPYVNILRTTTEALSALIGGVDCLTTNCFDESFKVPDEFSQRLARNIQLILREEVHLDELIDAAGGSYYVEVLTTEIAEQSWKIVKEIEKMGGMIAALRTGYPQNEISKTAAVREKEIENQKAVIVGVNKFKSEKEIPPQRLQFDSDTISENRKEEIHLYKSKRNYYRLSDILISIASDSVIEGNTEKIIEAFKNGATIGEVTSALRKYPKIKESIPAVKIHRATENYEEIRSSINFSNNQSDSLDIIEEI